VIIWVVAFIVASIFVGFQITGMWKQIITTLAVVIAAFVLAKRLNVSKVSEMLKYSFSWVVVGLILDYFITTRFTGKEFLMTPEIWIGYALILIVPLLAVKKEQKSA
jgi:uncharacterized membrane protein required for colicin V production